MELGHRPTDILSKQESQEVFPLNLYDDHFSYIKRLAKYNRCYTCQRCNASPPKAWYLIRHECSCEAKVKRVYPDGVHHLSKTIFEKIKEEGFAVPQELKYSQYRATFDIEVNIEAVTAYVDHQEQNRRENQRVGSVTLYSTPKPHRRKVGARISTTIFTSEHVRGTGGDWGEYWFRR